MTFKIPHKTKVRSADLHFVQYDGTPKTTSKTKVIYKYAIYAFALQN